MASFEVTLNHPRVLDRARRRIETIEHPEGHNTLSRAGAMLARAEGWLDALVCEGLIDQATYALLLDEAEEVHARVLSGPLVKCSAVTHKEKKGVQP